MVTYEMLRDEYIKASLDYNNYFIDVEDMVSRQWAIQRLFTRGYGKEHWLEAQARWEQELGVLRDEVGKEEKDDTNEQ